MSSLKEINPVVRELFDSKTARSTNGDSFEVNSNIRLEFADALFKAVLKYKPKTVIEIGMAYGISSLAILTALSQIGENGKLVSVDPFQSTDWHSCGISAVRRAGFENSHELIENFDYLALPELLGKNFKVDFAYIDGWHTFDYAMLDFWFIDKMLNSGGIVAFNDCHLPAVSKVISFVLSHRKYSEIDVELPAEYSNYTPLREVKRIIANKPRNNYYLQAQDRYFKKIEDFEPAWDFYAEF